MTTTLFWQTYLVAVAWAVARAVVLFGLGTRARGRAPRSGRVAQALARLRGGGSRTVAAAYLVPGVSEASQVAAGMSGMPVATFARGIALAALPWALVDAAWGSALVGALSSGWGPLVVTALVVAAVVVRRRRGSRPATVPARSGAAGPVPALVC